MPTGNSGSTEPESPGDITLEPAQAFSQSYGCPSGTGYDLSNPGNPWISGPYEAHAKRFSTSVLDRLVGVNATLNREVAASAEYNPTEYRPQHMSSPLSASIYSHGVPSFSQQTDGNPSLNPSESDYPRSQYSFPQPPETTSSISYAVSEAASEQEKAWNPTARCYMGRGNDPSFRYGDIVRNGQGLDQSGPSWWPNAVNFLPSLRTPVLDIAAFNGDPISANIPQQPTPGSDTSPLTPAMHDLSADRQSPGIRVQIPSGIDRRLSGRKRMRSQHPDTQPTGPRADPQHRSRSHHLTVPPRTRRLSDPQHPGSGRCVGAARSDRSRSLNSRVPAGEAWYPETSTSVSRRQPWRHGEHGEPQVEASSLSPKPARGRRNRPMTDPEKQHSYQMRKSRSTCIGCKIFKVKVNILIAVPGMTWIRGFVLTHYIVYRWAARIKLVHNMRSAKSQIEAVQYVCPG